VYVCVCGRVNKVRLYHFIFKKFVCVLCMNVCMCECVCVCERERESDFEGVENKVKQKMEAK
jgi:hypothetical protein